jgi:hypothetical protein
MNFAETSLVQDSIGSTSSHLVTYSTAVMMYLAPVLLALCGNGSTKLIAQILKARLDFIELSGISFFHKGRPSL